MFARRLLKSSGIINYQIIGIRKCWASTAAQATTFTKPSASNAMGIRKIRREPPKWLTSTPLSEWSKGKLRFRLVGWTVFFAGFFSWAAWYGRSIQIKYTPLFKGIMFTLRQDPQVREWIGSDLSSSARVDGFVNHIKGKADLAFDIAGSKGQGRVEIKASRKQKDWFIQEMSVVIAGEQIVDIRSEEQEN